MICSPNSSLVSPVSPVLPVVKIFARTASALAGNKGNQQLFFIRGCERLMLLWNSAVRNPG